MIGLSETKDRKNKLTKVQRNIIIAVSAISLFIVGFGCYFGLKPDNNQKVEVAAVVRSDIQQKVSNSGTVECSEEAVIDIPIGSKVLEVNVKEGDTVKKGDVLATFDIKSLNQNLKVQQAAYNEAMKAYKESLNSSATASDALVSIDKQIADIEKQIASLGGGSGKTEAQAQQLIQMIQLMKNSGMSITDMMKISEALKNSGVDMSGGMMDAVTNVTSSLEAQLIELKAKKAVYEVQSTLAMSDIYKAAADSATEKMNTLKLQIEQLSGGLTAQKDGVITKVNISPDSVFAGVTTSPNINWQSLLSGDFDINSVVSMLSSVSSGSTTGMKIAYYDGFEVAFSVGKYDILNVALGQKAVISSKKNKFDGAVKYISAVAGNPSGGSQGFDISSITSALTGSSAGVPVKVSIENPDKSVIIGLDVDVDVIVNEFKDVNVVPFESILTEGTQKFVYLYNKKNKKITKTQVEVGASSDNYCQILSGLETGDIVVKAISPSLEDGMKIYPTNKITPETLGNEQTTQNK